MAGRMQHAGPVWSRLRVSHERVVGVAQETRFDAASLHPAVGHRLGAQTEGREVQRLPRVVVQDDREAPTGIALDPGHDPRRVLDLDLGAVLAQLEAGATVCSHPPPAGVESADGLVGDGLAVAVPATVLGEPDLAGMDGGEARARHQAARSSLVSRTIVTGPSFTSARAMCAWNRPVSTGTRVARAAATKRS